MVGLVGEELGDGILLTRRLVEGIAQLDLDVRGQATSLAGPRYHLVGDLLRGCRHQIMRPQAVGLHHRRDGLFSEITF
jgi:hypothetical protein